MHLNQPIVSDCDRSQAASVFSQWSSVVETLNNVLSIWSSVQEAQSGERGDNFRTPSNKDTVSSRARDLLAQYQNLSIALESLGLPPTNSKRIAKTKPHKTDYGEDAANAGSNQHSYPRGLPITDFFEHTHSYHSDDENCEERPERKGHQTQLQEELSCRTNTGCKTAPESTKSHIEQSDVSQEIEMKETEDHSSEENGKQADMNASEMQSALTSDSSINNLAISLGFGNLADLTNADFLKISKNS